MTCPTIYRISCYLLIAAVSVSCVTSPVIDKGAAYYDQGLYDQAGIEWRRLADEGNYVAEHNLGILSALGLGSTQQSYEDAATWFQKSAEQGYVPAMVSLAEVQTLLGDESIAESWLNLAARWGNTEAIGHLHQRGLPIPEPDLFIEQHQELERSRAIGPLIDYDGGNYPGRDDRWPIENQ